MQNTRIFSYLGFAIKSRKVVYGTDNIADYKKKMHLIMLSNTLSKNARDKIERRADLNKIRILALSNEEFTQLVQKDGCMAIAITSFELAQAIIKEVEQNRR